MTEDHPFNNRTTYGATKIANEQMLRAMYEQHKLPYIGMRYMNIYGPRMDYEGTYISVIMKVLDRIFAGQRPVVFGDGSQVYDFVHVADVARANMLGMQADCVDENFNIGMGLGTSINELVQLLLELTGSQLTIEYQPQAQSFVTHRIGSTEKAERAPRLQGHHPAARGTAVGRRLAHVAARRPRRCESEDARLLASEHRTMCGIAWRFSTSETCASPA